MTDAGSALLERVLEAAEREFADRNLTFSNLDTKAQSTITTAGIFLAAATAFLSREAIQEYLKLGYGFVLVLLGGSIVLLLASVAACLYAMRIRRVPGPLGIESMNKMIDDFLRLDQSEIDDSTHQKLLREEIEVWRNTLEGIFNANEGKARAVLIGQILLGTAIGLLALLLVIRIFTVDAV